MSTKLKKLVVNRVMLTRDIDESLLDRTVDVVGLSTFEHTDEVEWNWIMTREEANGSEYYHDQDNGDVGDSAFGDHSEDNGSDKSGNGENKVDDDDCDSSDSEEKEYNDENHDSTDDELLSQPTYDYRPFYPYYYRQNENAQNGCGGGTGSGSDSGRGQGVGGFQIQMK